MSPEYSIREARFQHVVLEGTSYEVGRWQAEVAQQRATPPNIPLSLDYEPGHFGFRDLTEMQELMERYCPGLNDEIRGFADGLGLPLEKIFHYGAAYPRLGQCSHMVALPAITADGHVYAGRSYELNPDDEDLRLCTTRVRGKAAHVGFSTVLLGRLDGINEHGLAVTMSSVRVAEPPQPKGLDLWVAVRALLDGCKSVGEAVDLLLSMPLCGCTNYIVMDREGSAALVEVAGARRTVRRIGPTSEAQYLLSTTHYTSPELVQFNGEGAMGFTAPLYKAVEAWLQAHAPYIGKETLRGILSKEWPDGCCCPFYQQGAGTLWSMILDVTAGEVEVCFGAPTHNGWRSYTPRDGTAGAVEELVARFPSKKG